ncbi:hypothetical protein B0H34DRAFT_734458 [Crassisporium funariophilum]|nr:hypothetical protein B0H34DRAFT_734458 [Crassisporium funariophilum]
MIVHDPRRPIEIRRSLRTKATVRSIVYSPRRCIEVLRPLSHDFAVSIILAVVGVRNERKQLREVNLSSYTPRRCNEIRRVSYLL